MKKSLLFILLTVVIAAGVFAAALWLRSQKVDVVRSSDGSAELHIPAGALPEGVELASISIVRLETETEGHLARYELSPDGLQFLKPVEIAVTVSASEQPATNATYVPVPVLALMSSDGKTMENVTSSTELDAEAEQIVATANISHFSQMNVLSFVSARIDNPTDHVQFETFFVGIRMTQDRGQIRVPIENDPLYVAYIHEMNEWYLQGGAFFSETRATAPEEIRDIPQSATPGVQVMDRKSFSEVRQFTCARLGDAKIGYRVFMDGSFGHFMEDRENVQTSFNIPNEDLSDQLIVKTRPFRCLGGEETVITDPPEEDDDVVIDRSHDLVLLRNGKFETTITPSSTRITVGETVNIDVVITDVTDRSMVGMSDEAKRPYQIPWAATGVWIADPIFDRTDVDVEGSHTSPYLGRLTFRLPLTCVNPGTGVVYFNSFIERVVEGQEGVHRTMPLSGGTSVQTVPIECVAPVTEGEDQTEPIGLQVTPVNLFATHVVGSTSCPQAVGTFKVIAPPGATWDASGIPPWIDMSATGTAGDVLVQFNCNISNYTAHTEEATVTFTSGGQSAEASVRIDVQ